MSLTFGITSKKRPTAVYMGYKFNQYSKNNKDCVHWGCVEYTRFKCRAKLVTFETEMLQNLTPLHTHPATKSSVVQKRINNKHEQQANGRKCDSFRTEAIEKQDDMQKTYSPLSSPANSNDMNAEENNNELQALYNTLSPAANYKDLDETSDEEFYKRWNASTIEKGAKSQRFRKNRVAKPESVAFNAKPAASKTLLRTKNILHGRPKNYKLNQKSSRQIKWLNY